MQPAGRGLSPRSITGCRRTLHHLPPPPPPWQSTPDGAVAVFCNWLGWAAVAAAAAAGAGVRRGGGGRLSRAAFCAPYKCRAAMASGSQRGAPASGETRRRGDDGDAETGDAETRHAGHGGSQGEAAVISAGGPTSYPQRDRRVVLRTGELSSEGPASCPQRTAGLSSEGPASCP